MNAIIFQGEARMAPISQFHLSEFQLFEWNLLCRYLTFKKSKSNLIGGFIQVLLSSSFQQFM